MDRLVPGDSAGRGVVGDPPESRRRLSRFRPGRWSSVLLLLLLAFGFWMLLRPVTTEDGEPSCGSRPAIMVAFGRSTGAQSPNDADWCRDEARSAVGGGVMVVVLSTAVILMWWVRPSRWLRRDRAALGREHAKHPRTEYVLTDAAGALIAVIRPAFDVRVDAPAWRKDSEPWGVAIGSPGGDPALFVAAGVERKGRMNYRLGPTNVWVTPGILAGSVSVGLRGTRQFTYSSATQQGQVRRIPGSSRAWSVVDVSGLELARITSRQLVSSPATSDQDRAPQRGLLPTIRADFREAFVGCRRMCEVTEFGASFDWNEHGLLVALAALCDKKVQTCSGPANTGL